MPPITATALMTVSASANEASRMSSLIPPSVATAVYSGGTTHWPSRLAPPRMASESLNRGVPPILRRAGVAAGCRVLRGREVAGDRGQIGEGLGAVHAGQPFVQLVDGDPALGVGLAQHLRGTVSIGVGDAQVGPVIGRIALRSTLAIMSDHEAIRRGRPCERPRPDRWSCGPG